MTQYTTVELHGLLAERYRGQLEAYAYALERMTGKRVKEKALFFLRTGTAAVF